jgi:hypothetical protein
MTDFEQLKLLLEKCNAEQNQEIFRLIRGSILIHPFERMINAKAEVILEAVSRSGDLTQRGIRGIVAEATFFLEVLPTLKGWKVTTLAADFPYDALVERDGKQVRIQVKMQRKKDGKPMMANQGYRDLPADHYVVEVQRTRGGLDKSTGEATRPYRFKEFDLLAVSMEVTTKEWKSFMYAPADRLQPDPTDKDIIRKFQPVPPRPSGIWIDNLQRCLDEGNWQAPPQGAGAKT